MEIDEISYSKADLASNLALDELAAEIVAAAGRLSAATCAWLLLVAKFDAASDHVRAGFASTAHWLSFACGLAHRTAVEHVRVARALAAHEALSREMGAGRLSYSHVRAISRVAEPTEHQLVDELIEVAQYGTVAHLETIVRGLRTVDDIEGSTRDEREYVKHNWNDSSLWQLSARLDPERGEVVSSAIKSLAEREELSSADALVRLAEIGLAALADADKPPRALRGHERAAVVVHLDAANLRPPVERRSAERARPFARITNGPGLPSRVVERLLCAGRIRPMVFDGESALDVGRTQRLVTERQYRALMVRHHGHCAVPGCSNVNGLDGHHVIPWSQGGRTDLDNLILLCEPHHLGVHNDEFTITSQRRGRFTFTRPDGTSMMPTPTKDDHSRSVVQLHETHGAVAPNAATGNWTGQRLEPDYAVSVLAHRRQRARDAAGQDAASPHALSG
jgi:5-methylcytosine-specific restriction endonuclease McrA